MSRENHLTCEALSKQCRVLTDEYGIKVEFGGAECKTDGKTIRLPYLGPEIITPEALKLMRYFIDHEAGHLVGKSDVKLMKSIIKQSPKNYHQLAEMLFGAVEDRRAEGIMTRKWTGCGLNLSSGAEYIAESMQRRWDEDKDGIREMLSNPIKQFTTAAYLYNRGVKMPSFIEQKYIDGVDRCAAKLYQADHAKDTAGIVDAYNDLFGEIVSIIERPPEPPEQPQGGQGGGQGSQPGKAGGHGGAGGTGGGNGGDEPEQQAGGPDDGESEPEDGEEDQDGETPLNEPQKPTTGTGQGGNHKQGGGFDPNIKVTDWNDEFEKAFNEEVKESVADAGRGLEEHDGIQPLVLPPMADRSLTRVIGLNEAMTEKRKNYYNVEYESLSVSNKAENGKEANILLWKQKIKKIGGSMQQRLAQILMSEAKVDWRRNRKNGHVDPRKVSSIALSTSKRCFRKPTTADAPDTACLLLIDGSGSMGSGKGSYAAHAMDAAAVFATALDFAGHANMVCTFGDYTPANFNSSLVNKEGGFPLCWNGTQLIVSKGWNDSTKTPECWRKLSVARGIAYGGTPGAEAIRIARHALMERTEKRKVLMIFTDGGPNCHQTAVGESLLCERYGIEVVAIGIKGAPAEYFARNAVKTLSATELPKVAAKELAKILAKH